MPGAMHRPRQPAEIALPAPDPSPSVLQLLMIAARDRRLAMARASGPETRHIDASAGRQPPSGLPAAPLPEHGAAS